MLEIAAALILVGAAPIELLEVVAGAERRAVGGEDHDAHGVVVGDRGQGVAERFQHRLGEAVEGLRPVERQDGDA